MKKIFLYVMFVFVIAGCAARVHDKADIMAQAQKIQMKYREKNPVFVAVQPDVQPQEVEPVFEVEQPAQILKQSKKPYLYPMPDFEKLTYKVKYLGVYVAVMTASIKGRKQYKGREVYEVELLGRTNAFFNKVFKMEDRFTTYIDAEYFTPIRHEEYRREGRYKRDAVLDFDHENQKAYFKHLLNDEEKEIDIPKGIHDSLSAVYYFRRLPLDVGDTIDYDVNVNEKNYDLFGVVEARKTIKIYGLGKFDAYVFQPYVELNGETVQKGKLKGYFTADHRRIPLRAEVKTPIFGKATITLTKIE